MKIKKILIAIFLTSCIGTLNAQHGFEYSIFKSICIELLMWNDYSKIQFEINDKFQILLDPKTSENILDTIECLTPQEKILISNLNHDEVIKILLMDSFPIVLNNREIVIYDTINFFSNTYKFNKDSLVFLTATISKDSISKVNENEEVIFLNAITIVRDELKINITLADDQSKNILVRFGILKNKELKLIESKYYTYEGY